MTLAGMSVLLAEDNLTNQMVAMHMLESLGAEVTVANDGAEALEVLDGRRFDVALIDIEMPRVSGLDVIRRLRARPGPVASMPMIALTAYVMREHRAAIEEAGADGIISKPIVSIGTFGTEILTHVRERRGRAPAGEPPAPNPDFNANVYEDVCASFGPGGRRAFVSRVMLDIAGACESVAAAIHARDFDAIRAATHPLTSVAGTIGANRLQRLAGRLNSAGQVTEDIDIENAGAELLLEAEIVLKLLCGEWGEAER